jgi:hypothetical protein
LFFVFSFPVRQENSGFVRSSFHLLTPFLELCETHGSTGGVKLLMSFVYFLLLFDLFEKLSFLGCKSVIKKSGCAFEEEAEGLLRRVFFFLRQNCKFSTNSCILIPGAC